MTASDVSLDLMEFIEKNILPRYSQFDRAHNMGHVTRVIRNSLLIAKAVGADFDMVYTVAAYHDLGLSGPRAIHHLTSGKIMAADVRLRKWFSAEQIRLMKEAVEDHRASASHTPRNIYGKIVAEADRELDPDVVFRRAVEYGLDIYPEKKEEEQWQRFRKHISEKYGREGYIRLWIPNSPNAKNLAFIREVISNTEQLHEIFTRLYSEISASSAT